jgi:MFS family permease
MSLGAVLQERTTGEVLRWSAVLLTTAAAAIHFAVTPQHFDEDWAFGVFFAAAAWVQILWALLVVRSGHRRLLLTGVAGNLAIALVWAASRTTGLPVGPEPGTRETVEFIDVLATGFEILAAVTIFLALRWGTRRVAARHGTAIIATVALVVILTATAALATRAGSAHDPEVSRHDSERVSALRL